MRKQSIISIFLLVVLSLPMISFAQPMGRGGMYRNGPYGHYCRGMQWGPYGARKPVATIDNAKQVIQTYLSEKGQGLHVGKVVERNWYFEADILDKSNTVIDQVIVDKRSGRIRSTY